MYLEASESDILVPSLETPIFSKREGNAQCRMQGQHIACLERACMNIATKQALLIWLGACICQVQFLFAQSAYRCPDHCESVQDKATCTAAAAVAARQRRADILFVADALHSVSMFVAHIV